MRIKSASRSRKTPTLKGFFFKKNSVNQSFFESASPNKFFGSIAHTIRRKCDDCNKDQHVHRKTNHAPAATDTSVNSHAFLNKLDSSGQTLPTEHQHFFGKSMNHDFSEVRIHTTNEAAESASDLNAKAYTYQQHIVFNKNNYQPSTREGKKLLAHELTHVLQNAADINRDKQDQPQPETEWIPPDIGPIDDVLRARQDPIRASIIPLIEASDAAGLTARLRSLTRRQAFDMFYDEQFLRMLEDQFQGIALWSIFSIMLSRGEENELARSLDAAILSRQAQRVVDLLTLMRSPTGFLNILRRRLLRIVAPQIFGGYALQPQIMDLLQDTPSLAPGAASISFDEVHYEADEHGQMALERGGTSSEIDFRATATQMRVVVPMNFVQPNHPFEPFYFISGSLPSVLDNWLTTIQQVWNNKFYLYNGQQNLLLVFVPIAVHAGSNRIEVHTNNAERCPGVSQPGRAEANCYFTTDNGNVAAHEFGHLIGANDEYNLPATASEIPASIRSQMSPEDIEASTVEGITRRRLPAVAGGHDIPDSVMSQHEASQRVYARHVQRLVNAINAQLPAGVPPYRIRRVGSI
jgi:hypothetical protein